MHVISPRTYQKPAHTPKRPRKWKGWLVLPLLLAVAATINCTRPLPAAVATVSVHGLGGNSSPVLSWPAGAQAAVGAPGYGVLASSGTQTPLATASTAKVILALCVLEKQPVASGKSGTTYTVSAKDVGIYDTYVNNDGSVAAVAEGEKLTEYQAIEALMLPSANNIADSLVGWVFGSQSAYQAYASNYLSAHGMAQTSIGTDASGYDPSTTSTASDLTKLGLLALKNQTLMEIAGKRTTTLPVAGIVHNYDTVLGQNGINGLKTGNNDQDPGVFVFTATLQIGSTDVPVTGSVMGASDLQTALDSAAQLAGSMQRGFEQLTIATKGADLGTMRTAWGTSEPITASDQLQLVRWKDTALSETHQVRSSLQAGTVGSLQVSGPGASARTELRLQHTIPGPSFWWRLTRH